MSLVKVLGGAALCGLAGWALENVLSDRPRYSAAFRGAPVPFLPVYAVGGAVVIALAPKIRNLSAPARAAIYAAASTGVELVACDIDRNVLDARSWDYGPSVIVKNGCVNYRHSIAWGVLGLLAEQALGRRSAR
jgi:uncharacterized membrane protein